MNVGMCFPFDKFASVAKTAYEPTKVRLIMAPQKDGGQF